MASHIQLRRKIYHARLGIPEELRAFYNGRRELIQSLKTADRSVAELRAMRLVSDWKLQFQAHRGNTDALAVVALEIRTSPENKTFTPMGSTHAEEYADFVAEGLADEKKRPFFDIALGRSTPFLIYLDAFLKQWEVEEKTKQMARTIIRRVAYAYPTTEMITRPAVKKLLQEDTNSSKTKAKNYGFVAKYWKYLQDMEAVSYDKPNPFAELGLKSNKRKKTDSEERKPFSIGDIIPLIEKAKETGYEHLSALVTLGAYTGARIEEICSLRVADIKEIDGIDCICIADAKTTAGIREVPIHSKLKDLIRTLSVASTDGYLLSGLTVNKYGDRSNAIGKRFGRLKTQLGYGPDRVFHSIRKTVTTIFENSGIEEGLAADIVGHEKKTITYGLYSGGSSTERKQQAIQKITYKSANN